MRNILKLAIIAIVAYTLNTQAQVHVNPPFAMPDVNVTQVGDKAYLFCGTDLDPFNQEIQQFIMPYWKCFSSTDLIHWEFESMLDPKNLYMGESDKCFAGHGVYKNDQWYWYFSDYVNTTGVATSKTTKGPWKDALGKPLLPKDISITKEYDNCVFTDDDNRSYMVYGSWIDKKICYHIVELNNDMISLKEKPTKIEVNGVPEGQAYIAVDAPFLHKANGMYYLSWRRPYAVSKNIKGPYTYLGYQDAAGHGGFFDFNNQNFVNFTSLKEGYRRRFRFVSFAYVNYLNDGSIAPIAPEIEKNGVGQYDAKWNAIEAEWYMGMPNGPKKQVLSNNKTFIVANLQNGDYLRFPNINNCNNNATIEFTYACNNANGGTIIIKAFNERGPEIGRVHFTPTANWDTYKTVSTSLDNPPGSVSLAFVFEGDSNTELIRLDKFTVQ